MNRSIFVVYMFCISCSQIYGRSVNVTDLIIQKTNDKIMDANENRSVNSSSETSEVYIGTKQMCKYITS